MYIRIFFIFKVMLFPCNSTCVMPRLYPLYPLYHAPHHTPVYVPCIIPLSMSLVSCPLCHASYHAPVSFVPSRSTCRSSVLTRLRKLMRNCLSTRPCESLTKSSMSSCHPCLTLTTYRKG